MLRISQRNLKNGLESPRTMFTQIISLGLFEQHCLAIPLMVSHHFPSALRDPPAILVTRMIINLLPVQSPLHRLKLDLELNSAHRPSYVFSIRPIYIPAPLPPETA